MEKEAWFDLIINANTLALFLLTMYLGYLRLAPWIQILPAVLFVVPMVIAFYKRRMRIQETERQRDINKAKDLDTLLVKLQRVRDSLSSIGSNLTHNNEFINNEAASIGWRTFFNRYGESLNAKFDYFRYDLESFIGGERKPYEEFGLEIMGFYHLVRDFRHLYDDLREMIEKANVISRDAEQAKSIRKLEANYTDFHNSLGNLCDGDEEVRKRFAGTYVLTQPKRLMPTRVRA